MSEKNRSAMADAAQALLNGQHRLSELRCSFGEGLQFAVDNDVVMDFVRPSPKKAAQARSLLREEDGFSVREQEISLVERVAGYILFDAAKAGSGKVYSLPGHHAELWGSLAGGIHARLTNELRAKGSPSQVTEQMRRFRDTFYHAAVTGNKKLTIEQLIAQVPDQMMGWLGLGTASQEWDRLKYLKVKNVLRPFPREVIDRTQLADAERQEFFDSLLASRNKWQRRLEISQAAWLAEGGDARERTKISLRNDAVALAYWEFLNREFYRPPRERLALVTSSDRIYGAARDISASELGGADDESLSIYLLHPFDFLNECHLNLSGELRPGFNIDIDIDGSGRLSSALEMLVNAESSRDVSSAEEEFGVVWGKFLRASVLERVKRINRAQTTHLRRVAFVFSRVGISAETTAGNPLAHKLAESGSEMLSEAADIRIASLEPEQFTRGAPILRLDKHPWAQEIQLAAPQEYCRLLIDTEKRKNLLAEAGDHRYTLHLLQARAMIWAGDWRTALRLAEFALSVRDKLPNPKDYNMVQDIDGREAEFLAAVCERHAHGNSVESLAPALNRASRHLNVFLALAGDGQTFRAITELDLHVHQLRAESELIAIDTTKFLLQILLAPERKDDGASSDRISELAFAEFLSHIRRIRLSALEAIEEANGAFSDGIFIRYICARVLQQLWCNEFQIRLFADDKFQLAKTIELERLWIEQNEIQAQIGQLKGVAVPRSWFVETLTCVLAAMLGHDTGQSKGALLNRLALGDIDHVVFPYDRQRNERLRQLLKTACE